MAERPYSIPSRMWAKAVTSLSISWDRSTPAGSMSESWNFVPELLTLPRAQMALETAVGPIAPTECSTALSSRATVCYIGSVFL